MLETQYPLFISKVPLFPKNAITIVNYLIVATPTSCHCMISICVLKVFVLAMSVLVQLCWCLLCECV